MAVIIFNFDMLHHALFTHYNTFTMEMTFKYKFKVMFTSMSLLWIITDTSLLKSVSRFLSMLLYPCCNKILILFLSNHGNQLFLYVFEYSLFSLHGSQK